MRLKKNKSKYTNTSYKEFVELFNNTTSYPRRAYYKAKARTNFPNLFNKKDFIHKAVKYINESYDSLLCKYWDTGKYDFRRYAKEYHPNEFESCDFISQPYRCLSYEQLSTLFNKSKDWNERGHIKKAALRKFQDIFNEKDFYKIKESPRFFYRDTPYKKLIKMHKNAKTSYERYLIKIGILRYHKEKFDIQS